MRSEEKPWIVVTLACRPARCGGGKKIEAVVDDVELHGTLEQRRDVQALPDLGVERGVFGIRWVRFRPARASAVGGGKQRASRPRSTSPSVNATRTVPTVHSDAEERATRSARAPL
jgi:hypothetical protein